MWHFIIGALLATAVIVVIAGIITKGRIREEMRKKGLNEAIIKQIDQCENKVTIEDLYSDETIELQGDGISDELETYETIHV